MNNQQLARLGVEALAAVCLLWCAVRIFGLAHGAPVTLALAIAYVVPRLIHDHAAWRSNASMWLMTAVGIGLCALTMSKMAYITVFSGHTLDAPLLTSDSASYYQWALHHYDGSVDIAPNEECRQAVRYIFDENHDAVQHRVLYMYNPYLVQSSFHESQNFILSYAGVRFFDRWG